ncbi:MAG TPA: prenyltransferase/squalene oxidase repeat-containing protein [Planctomycetota bacterium]|nr:prenyltransferase/squalene oxidase repeat-containing protein [Planctomycetota bacterium]
MNHADSEQLRIESSLPKHWEVETTFHDTLYDWMSSAPWLAISAAAHGVVILVMLMIPWELLEERPSTVFVSGIEQPMEEPFEDPPPPELPEAIEKPANDDPTKVVESPDDLLPSNEPDDAEPAGDPDVQGDHPFDYTGSNPVIGIGGDPGSKLGKRGPGHGGRGQNGSSGTEIPLGDSLKWLKAHQSPDGSWDCDGFMSNCGQLQAGSSCDGPGEGTHDVGMTGLAMLAFLGDGSTTREGPYKEQVAKAVKWLKEQQETDTGVYGERVGHSFMYDHAIATLAMCEAYYFSRNPLLRRSAQDAINFITRARNPYGAWRYASPPAGDNDTSVSGWCVFAMASAQEGGLTIDPEGFIGASQWIEDMTDPATGRTGYDTIGSASSRVGGLNEQYPTDKGEAMTSVAILSRVFMGQDVAKNPLVDKGADLLKKHLPEWDADGLGNDMYYWYYGSYALFQLGGPRWEAWNKAAKQTLLAGQRKDGDMQGSWDPKDAWGHSGGRVYTTALGALCLEVYFRYSRVLGGR